MKKLLIVDMQIGFITKNNDFLVKNIEKLIQNGNFDQIIATKFVNNKKSQYAKFLDYTKFCGGEEIEFALDLPKNALVFEKTSYAMRGGISLTHLV